MESLEATPLSLPLEIRWPLAFSSSLHFLSLHFLSFSKNLKKIKIKISEFPILSKKEENTYTRKVTISIRFANPSNRENLLERVCRSEMENGGPVI